MAKPSKVESLLLRGKELHRLLNSANPPSDLDELHKQLFAAGDKLAFGGRHSELSSSDGYQFYLHDSFIEEFSERRSAQGWTTRFSVSATAYQIQEGGDGEEKGYMRVEFDLSTKQPLRAMSNREIYSFLIDTDTKQIGASFHKPEGGLDVVVADYDTLGVKAGPLLQWEDLLLKRLAGVPHLPATLTVESADQKKEEHASRWYRNGSILVQKDDRWIPYCEFAADFYRPSQDVRRVSIDTGVPGVKSMVSANSDERGYGYADVRPLRIWFRDQARLARKQAKAASANTTPLISTRRRAPH